MVDERKQGEPTIASHLLDRSADASPGLVFEGRTWTWAEVVAEASTRAAVLRTMRRSGPFHAGVLLDNVPEYVFNLFGAAMCGATVVGLNSTRRGAELAQDIIHTDCQLILTDTSRKDELSSLRLGLPSGGIVDVESGDYADLVKSVTDAGAGASTAKPDDLYLLIFTAGSTGTPKAVRMSHGRAARTAADSARAFGPDDVLYCAMPLFHGNALVANLFPGLITGASIVLKRRFSASGFGPEIRAHGCTYFNYVGRALSYIVAVPETAEDGDNRLKWALGSEASPQNIAEFSRRYRCPVFEGYGSSENAVVIAPAPGMPPGALGKPRPDTDVAIVDPVTGAERATAVLDAEGRLLNPAEAIGEIVGRNTSDRFEGYYNNPEADAARTRDGLYWTGDLGYRDEQSFFYFAGRTADWIRVDGENFSAGSVERIINRFAACTGSAVYAVPDPVTGDQVMATLEIGPDRGFDPGAFEEFLAAQPDLGTKWSPRFVRVVSALPVTGAGKVDKAPLREARWDGDGRVWWRPQPGAQLTRMTEHDASQLDSMFEAHGRGRFLGSSAAAGTA